MLSSTRPSADVPIHEETEAPNSGTISGAEALYIVSALTPSLPEFSQQDPSPYSPACPHPWMDEQKDKQVDRRMNGCGRVDGQTGRIDGYRNWWMSGWVGRWVGGCAVVWMDRQKKGKDGLLVVGQASFRWG